MQNNDDVTFKGLFFPLTTKKVIVFLFLIGFIVFFNSLFNGFVWDDINFIKNNPDIKSINIISYFLPNSTTNTQGYYRPLYNLYFSVLYPIFGDNAFLYRSLQILFHIINSFLIFTFFKRIIKKELSLVTSILFLIHPINVESTIFISAVLTPLSTLFGLSSLIKLQKEKLTDKEWLLIGILLFLSFLSKEEGILFLIMSFIFCILFKKQSIRPILFINTILISLYLFLRFISGNLSITNSNAIPITSLNLFERIINIPSIIFYYLKIFFFPLDMAVHQLWVVNKIEINNFYLPLLFEIFFMLFLLILGLRVFNNRKFFSTYLFSLIWLIIGLFIHINIIPLDMTVADRWFYFPLIGLLTLLSLAIEIVDDRVKNKLWIKNLGIYLFIILTIIFSIRTIIRNTNWYSQITLYEHDSKIESNYEMETDLGSEYYINGDYNNALIHFTKAIQLKPNERTYLNLGVLLQTEGKIKEAETYYIKGLKTNTYSQQQHRIILYNIYEKLGYLYIRYYPLEKAKIFLFNSLKEFPNAGNLWMDLAVVEDMLGNKNEALKAAEKAKQLNNDFNSHNLYEAILNNKKINISN